MHKGFGQELGRSYQVSFFSPRRSDINWTQLDRTSKTDKYESKCLKSTFSPITPPMKNCFELGSTWGILADEN